MVEDDDAIGFQRCAQEGLDGGIVDRPHLFVVAEVLHPGWMPHQRKAFAVEREILRDQSRIEDRDLMRLRQRRALGLARRRIEGVGTRLAGNRREIVEFGGDEGKRFEFWFFEGPWRASRGGV